MATGMTLDLGHPWVVNLLMDPFEANIDNVARRMAEHKTWTLTPMLGSMSKHFASFKEFPVRQVGLNVEFGKTIEKNQSKILSVKQ